jgi:hypothetical protein
VLEKEVSFAKANLFSHLHVRKKNRLKLEEEGRLFWLGSETSFATLLLSRYLKNRGQYYTFEFNGQPILKNLGILNLRRI